MARSLPARKPTTPAPVVVPAATYARVVMHIGHMNHLLQKWILMTMTNEEAPIRQDRGFFFAATLQNECAHDPSQA
jgi:hypothetical protein